MGRLASGVGELARRGVDVIVVGAEAVLKAAITATADRSIPVVFRAVDFDPLAKGYIASLAHPGGNLTGVAFQQPELITKRLDMLRQAVPHIARIVLLYDVSGEDQRGAATKAASALGISLVAIELRNPPYDYEHALTGTDGARGDALVATTSGFNRPAAAAEAALRHRLPATGAHRAWVEAGFLMSYGPSLPDMFRISADYVDKILKGAKPADANAGLALQIEITARWETLVQAEGAEQRRAAAAETMQAEIAVLRDALAQAELEHAIAAEAMRTETAVLRERLTQAERERKERATDAAALQVEIVTLQRTLAAARQVGKAAIAAFRIEAAAPIEPLERRRWPAIMHFFGIRRSF
jgi:putative ABC transport system substrate-binding protein